MQRLIIIRGNSASGKSTVAKKLREAMGHKTMLVPHDVVRIDMLQVEDESNNPSIQLIYDLAMHGSKIGFSVILEGVLLSKRYRDMLKKLIANFNGEAYIYYFDVPLETTLERQRLKPTAHEVSEEELRAWWVEKDYLGLPNEKIITKDMSEDQIIEMIVRDANL